MLKEIEGSSGDVKKQTELLMGGMYGSYVKFKAMIDTLLNSLFNAQGGLSMQDIFDQLNTEIDYLANNDNLLVWINRAVAGMAALLGVGIGLKIVAFALGPALSAVSLVMRGLASGALLNPWVWLVALIALAVLGIAALVLDLGGLRTKLQEAFGADFDGLGDAFGELGDALQEFGPAFSELWNEALPLIKQVLALMGPLLIEGIKIYIEIAKVVLGELTAAIRMVRGWLPGGNDAAPLPGGRQPGSPRLL